LSEKNFFGKIFRVGGIMVKVVFMGTPRIAVLALEHLVANGYNVVAAYTQPDKPAGRGRTLTVSAVKQAALSLGIPVMQPPNFKSEEDITRMKEFSPDVIVVCAYGQILTQAVLDIPPRQCINIHYSLLPKHRGASPVAAAILAGDEFTGVSIQLVRRKLDTGPLLISGVVAISPNDNTGSLMEKLSPVGAGLLLEGMSGWLRGTITPREQDENGATYFAQIEKSAGEIDWNLTATDIWRRIRAYNPWPGCFTRWKGQTLNIIEGLAVISGENIAEPGQVVALAGTKGGVGLGTGKGLIIVRRVKLAGKREMAAAEFIRGQRDFIGATLPN
jgi:methionyl-tRNA formyltransferase